MTTCLESSVKMAAIGFVIVIDDLLEALSRQKVVIDVPASGKIMYYRAGDETDYLVKLAEAAKLRKEGIPPYFPRNHRERGGRPVMSEERYLTFALERADLPKDTGTFEQIGITCDEMKDKDTRKLIFVNEEYKLRFSWLKPRCSHSCRIRCCGYQVWSVKIRFLKKIVMFMKSLDLWFCKCRMWSRLPLPQCENFKAS